MSLCGEKINFKSETVLYLKTIFLQELALKMLVTVLIIRTIPAPELGEIGVVFL